MQISKGDRVAHRHHERRLGKGEVLSITRPSGFYMVLFDREYLPVLCSKEELVVCTAK